MLTTKRKPASVGEILVEEFIEPMGPDARRFGAGDGVQRKHVNKLCNKPPQRDRPDRAHPRPRIRQMNADGA